MAPAMRMSAALTQWIRWATASYLFGRASPRFCKSWIANASPSGPTASPDSSRRWARVYTPLLKSRLWPTRALVQTGSCARSATGVGRRLELLVLRSRARTRDCGSSIFEALGRVAVIVRNRAWRCRQVCAPPPLRLPARIQSPPIAGGHPASFLG